MATRKQAKQEFPPACCGACTYCYGERDEWECWVEPPRPSEDDDGIIRRGNPTDPKHPPCVHFKHRQNG